MRNFFTKLIYDKLDDNLKISIVDLEEIIKSEKLVSFNEIEKFIENRKQNKIKEGSVEQIQLPHFLKVLKQHFNFK